MIRAILIGVMLIVIPFLTGNASPTLRVMLDFFATPNHIPLFVAAEQGFFMAEGIETEILIPANPSDPLKLAAARVVDVALTPQINFIIARSAGLPLISIGTLIETPLGGLLSLKEYAIEKLADLRGLRVGYSLAPLEPVLWQTMLASVGITSDDFQLVNVGFNTVLSLLSHSVDAIGAFRNFEVVQVALLGHEPVFFPQEDYGVPDTSEIILVTNPQLIKERPEILRAFIAGLARGITFTKQHPHEAFEIFRNANPELDDTLNRQAYEITLPFYAERTGNNTAQQWETMQTYLLTNGLIEDVVPVDQLYTDQFLTDP